MGEMTEFAKGDAGNGQLAKERGLLGTAIEDVQGLVGTMVGFLTSSAEDRRNVYKVGLNTTRLLMAVGDLVTAWLLLRQAEVAIGKLAGSPSAKDRAFYEGKVATARWFAANVLPELKSKRDVAETTTLELMDLDEASF
jgi:hypothetical protein